MSAAVVASANPFIDWSWIHTNIGLIGDDFAQHAELSGIAVGVGVVVAIPLAIVAWHFRRARTLIYAVAALLYTIPSIALFALIQPVTGYFSLETAESALVSYTLLILIRNIVTGLDAVSDDVREAAAVAGYSPLAQMMRIYVPLTLPALFGGLRVAAVTVIGLVTITGFVGWGGLGQLIISGFSEAFYTPIVVGLVLSVAFAAVSDAAIALLEHAVVRWNVDVA